MCAKKRLIIGGVQVPQGEQRDIRIKISETYTGGEVEIPIRVIRSKRAGPTVFVSAAIHGDEINGTGIIHDFMFGNPLNLHSGNLILIPVVNVFGFEGQQRYLPDRRDLNRSFPGSDNGSLARRIAAVFMREIVQHCDFGIDLHSAAFQRTNYPNVRGDLSNKSVRQIAYAFGCSLVVDGKGPEGSLRRESVKMNCPVIILEAGEPWKIEPSVLQIGVRGINNVLIALGMLKGKTHIPPYQTRVDKTTWVRSELGGILKFHVSPGDIVEKMQPIATNYGIFGDEQNILISPVDGIVLSMATMPCVKPGEPICLIAITRKKISSLKKTIVKSSKGLHHQVQQDLATSLDVSTFIDQNK